MLRRAQCWDPADAERVVQEDWDNDTKGRDALDEQLFLDALFELVDTWCRTIEAGECIAVRTRTLIIRARARNDQRPVRVAADVEFLSRLFESITDTDPLGKCAASPRSAYRWFGLLAASAACQPPRPLASRRLADSPARVL